MSATTPLAALARAEAHGQLDEAWWFAEPKLLIIDELGPRSSAKRSA